MFYFVVIILITGIYGCELDPNDSSTVLYADGEILNMTMTESAYPDDVVVIKMSGSCSSPMNLLPDQYLDDTHKKYEHLKQIKIPMTSALHDCAYHVTMRSRSACLGKQIVRFAMRPSRVPAAQCQVVVPLRWQEELRVKLAAETAFVCDAEQALCEDRNYSPLRNIVLLSKQIITNLGSNYEREIHIYLREEDFAQNVSTFVCQSASQRNLTVAGRLVTAASRGAADHVSYRAGDEYSATCSGPHGQWILQTDTLKSVENKTFTKKLEKEDNGMKLICVDINCEAFDSNYTCYKIILKEVTFRLKAPQMYGVIVGAVGAVGASLAAAAAWCAVRARRRAAPRDMSRRPRMPTPPPERPPHRQPYYSVPFERPIPRPRRD